MTGVYVLLIVLVAATLFGVWRKRTDGRMRPVSAATTSTPAPGPRGGDPSGSPASSSASAADGVNEDW